jgi:hypothetical protein
MKVNLGYYSAIAARNAINRTPLDLQNNPLSGKEINGIRNGEAYKLTISDKLVEFQTESMADFYAKDINVQKADPSDIFSYRPQDQWLVFSQYLHESDYFDSLSNEELTNIESTLQHITDGLDSLTQNIGIDFFGGVNSQLNSYEAHLELASSSSALQFFSNNFLSGDIKNGFDQLITKYVNHNMNKVSNYQSIEEKFYTARSKINPTDASLTFDQARHLSMTNKLGKTTYSDEEVGSIIHVYSEWFQGIKSKDDLSSILLKIQEQLVQFVTKGISSKDVDYQSAKDFISERSSDTFNRLADYWKMLL